jgi:hypothetical protein
VDRETAVDEKLGDDDEISVIGGQEQHSAREIDRLARPVAQMQHVAVRIDAITGKDQQSVVRLTCAEVFGAVAGQPKFP